eukprot:COSAG02_NODE_22367_length_755_cov_0.798780_1_plen_31_part_10
MHNSQGQGHAGRCGQQKLLDSDHEAARTTG